MDDENDLLEAELKRLRPASPSRELGARLEAELSPGAAGPAASSPTRPSARSARRWWWLAAAMPIAAALAVGLIRSGSQKADPHAAKPASPTIVAVGGAAALVAEEAGQFKPVSAENVLYAVSDEGLVTLADGTAARRERLNYVDTITWKNPRTNASVRWTLPREEVRVVPISFQ